MHEQRLLGGFYLGEHFIEPRTGQVKGPHGAVHLPPKAMELLLSLAARPGSLVTRSELLEQVWGEIRGSPERLSHAVSELRHALDDHPAEPRFIQTLPKRGYRLLIEPMLERAPSAAASVSAAASIPAGAAVPAGAAGPVSPSVPHVPARAGASAPSGSDSVGVFGEIRRRGVIETSVAYLALGWLLIQVARDTFDVLGLPTWTEPFVIYLVIVGFPIAILLAWFVEITPEGVILDVDPSSRPARPFRKSYVAILGALVLASAGVFVYDSLVGLPVDVPDEGANSSLALSREAIDVDPRSVAVLRFRNVGDTEDGRIFAEGLADGLIERFRKVPGLRVSRRGDSFSLEPDASSAEVRRRLTVAYYLEGTVQLTDDILRVDVVLIDSSNGFDIVSRPFEGEPEAFSEIQNQIVDRVTAELRVALPADRPRIAAAFDEASLDAFELYLHGMEALRKPSTRETIDEAGATFLQALDLDPRYAAAHAGLCMTYASSYRVTNDAGDIERAEQSCAEALDLNSNLYVVGNALGELYLQTGRYEDAEVEFKNALEIDDENVDALIGLGDVYRAQGRLSDAEGMLESAIALRPGDSQAYTRYGGFLYSIGRYQEAARQFRHVVSLDPEDMNSRTNLGAALASAGLFEEAARELERAIETLPTADAYGSLGLVQYYLGRFDDAAQSLKEAVDMRPSDYWFWSNLGDVLSFTREPAQARAAFEKAEELAQEELNINRRNAETIVDLAWIQAMLGKRREARELISRAYEMTSADPHAHYIDALILLRDGDRAGAIDKLEIAAEKGQSLKIIASEPHLRALRDNRRFQALVDDQESGE